VDRQGRFWAGTMNMVDSFRPDGALYRLDSDLTLHQMETGVSISNGTAWSPDNRTMYFTPTGDRLIWAYDFEPETGSISNRRVFAEFSEEDGLPDGHTVDSQGFLWSAFWGGWKVCRFDPDGKLEREIRIPSAQVTCPKFGGPNLDELYVTTAYSGLSEAERARQPEAGGLFRIQMDAKGLPEPEFAG
jgi:sugar lactone lactonase YvrE